MDNQCTKCNRTIFKQMDDDYIMCTNCAKIIFVDRGDKYVKRPLPVKKVKKERVINLSVPPKTCKNGHLITGENATANNKCRTCALTASRKYWDSIRKFSRQGGIFE